MLSKLESGSGGDLCGLLVAALWKLDSVVVGRTGRNSPLSPSATTGYGAFRLDLIVGTSHPRVFHSDRF